MSDDLYTTSEAFGERGDWAVLTAVILAGFLLTLGLLVVTRLGVTSVMQGDAPPATDTAPGVPADPSLFILDALLIPALDRDALPFRWIDPREAMDCGPESRVSVDGKPLRPGALVPVTPFVLDWESHGCRPFGARGARFDGRVRLTVSRDKWGFSAVVQPATMRITMNDGRFVLLRRSNASVEAHAQDQPPMLRKGLTME
jgi:hypothetical protein